ncbi:hypothetical protein B0A58_13655 [Flavobacterium branchiophilum NBRC 15030 = ATCC 35035]|uniref:isochorismate synthase n=1 Tax=Flavobacterium branchiophilum TaxID=55197 RepID=A0A543G6I5_9FLAO|nr:isochorismate synthase [Flavobacterium branchiophilum]OXA71551.1 hypothetical protein B0A58_13655 [Flavobacterium branchiophilum NBRC 15030 = ATCC 35035]TQM41685.1 isochorismate synthase [Flavobacterium branchiophilum]GEM56318.1 hypothetical protein FB1_25390 [Flavobacterium branchiophilum NBRC 15030 = ATCC 35035]
MDHLLQNAAIQFKNKRPFVLYKKPFSNQMVGMFQQDTTCYTTSEFTEQGFVFCSFDGSNAILIPKNKSKLFVETISTVDQKKTNNQLVEASNTNKSDYIQKIEHAIARIHQHEFTKIVLSRKAVFKLNTYDVFDLYSKMIDLYPEAFAYCWFHPQVGLWMGAFSERLLKIENQQFETMSVAGTQKNNPPYPIVWHEKEKDEQQIVTNYIIENLKNEVNTIEVQNPITLKAGNLLHLKTTISGTIKNESALHHWINILHPTPAVCGFPKEQAKKYVSLHENYNRAFYSGFLGEINFNSINNQQDTDLFVNLRCMQLQDNQAILYVGGGITKDSNPEKEWEETQNKLETMKRIFI